MKPNIVLLVADDQRGTAIGCEGIEPVQTPALDALASRGILCRGAYHHGSCSGAVCAPSRAMLHTGLPYTQLDDALLGPTRPRDGQPIEVPATLGGKLREAGYFCFASGKWHNGIDSFHASFDDGRAIFFGGMADHWFTPVHDFDPTGLYPNEAARPAQGFSTDVFGQATVDFITSQRDAEQPFFCYCAFTAPHDPRTPLDAYRSMYDPRDIPLPANFRPEHPFDNGELDIRDERLLGSPRDPNEIKRSLAAYYGMLSHMDAWVGRIHEVLEVTGQLANTLVIHTADHGLAIGQHGLLGKQNMYEHSVRVPLIAAGPGLPKSVIRDGLCYQHDLHPTILEIAGVNDSDGHFESVLPMWRGERTGRPYLTSAYRDMQRMVRQNRYKLIEYDTSDSPRRQMFDLANDPWEQHNLADDVSQRKRAAAMGHLITERADPGFNML